MRLKTMRRVAPLSAALLAAAPALAQQSLGSGLVDPAVPLTADRGRNTAVTDRSRPEYDAIGIPLGGFTVKPRLETGVGYSDNIFGQQGSGKTDSAFFNIIPDVSVTSNWSRHSASLNAGADLVRYAGNSVKNQDGYHIIGAGRYDLTGSTVFDIGGTIQRAYEERYSGDFPTASAAPVPITTTKGYARAIFEGARIRGLAGFDYQHLNYEDVEGLVGNRIDQDFRDRSLYEGTVRGEYGLSPDASLFVEGSYTRISYDLPLTLATATTAAVPNRDSKQYRILAGGSLDLTALIRASIGVGYSDRQFDDGALFKSIRGLAADAQIEYFVTPLTTVTLRARRFIDDAAQQLSSGYFATVLTAKVDHELLRNLLLGGEFNHEYDTFKDSPRHERSMTARATAKYMAARWLGFRLDGLRIDRKSNSGFPGSTFVENRAILSVTMQR